MAERQKRVVYFLLTLCLLVSVTSACSPETADVTVGNGGGGEDVPLVTVEPASFPTHRPDPLWQKEYDKPVTAALAASGDLVVVGWSQGSGSAERWGITVCDGEGVERWSRTFREARYRTISVDSIGEEPVIAASVFTYDNPGVLRAFRPDQTQLWTMNVKNSVSLAAAPGGDRVYCVDRGNSRLHVLDLATGDEMWSRAVSAEVVVQVAEGNAALLVEGDTLTLLDAGGAVVQRREMPQEAAGALLAPDGQSVFVALSGPHSAIYRFGRDGEQQWLTRIPSGGANCLSASADGKYVLVYNAFSAGGFVLLWADDGRILSRDVLASLEDAKNQFIRWVRFLPEDQGFVADYAVVREGQSGYSEEHRLLQFGIDGQLRRAIDLGRNVDILVSSDCRAAATVSTAVLDWTTQEKARVRFYDIGQLLSWR